MLQGNLRRTGGSFRRAVCAVAVYLLATAASPAIGAAVPPLPQEVAVDTLDDGRVVVRNPAPGRRGGPDEWRLVEELRLGQLEGTEPEVFGDVHDVAVDEKGHIYVMDGGSKEVRVFDREGRHLRNMARDGEGPGEFRYSEWASEQRIIWQPPNRLWVGDLWQQLSFDSLGNELSRTGQAFGPGFRPGSARTPGGALLSSTIVDADAKGFVYQEVTVSDRTRSGDQTISSHYRYGVRLPVYPEHPNPVLPRDTVLLDRRVSTTTAVPTSRSGSNITVGGIIKASVPRRVWGFARGETVWAANRAVHRFHEVTFTGDTVRTIELGNPPPPPPDDSDESEFEPVIASLDVSPEGWLWVLRFPDDADDPDGNPTWDLFDNCGRYRGAVSPPARLATVRFGGDTVDPIDLGAGGVIHGVARDALDVSYVLRLRLENANGTPVRRQACPS